LLDSRCELSAFLIHGRHVVDDLGNRFGGRFESRYRIGATGSGWWWATRWLLGHHRAYSPKRSLLWRGAHLT